MMFFWSNEKLADAEKPDRVSNMSKAEILRIIVTEKLSTAAREILAVVERTVAGYEEEAAGFREEIDRQRRQLEVLLQPQVKLEKIASEENTERLNLCNSDEEGEGEEEQHELALSSYVQLEEVNREDDLSCSSMLQQQEEVGSNRAEDEPGDDVQPTSAAESEEHGGGDEEEVDDKGGAWKPDERKIKESEHKWTRKRSRVKQRHDVKANSAAEGDRDCGGDDDSEEVVDDKDSDWKPGKRKIKESEHKWTRKRSRVKQQHQEATMEKHGTYNKQRHDVKANSSAEGDRDCGGDDDSEKAVDDKDSDWKPGKSDDDLNENEGKLTRKQQAKHSCVKTKNWDLSPLSLNASIENSHALALMLTRKQQAQNLCVKTESSEPIPLLNASIENSDAFHSCKVCSVLRGSMNILIKHAWSHVDDPQSVCGVCGEHSESAEELRNHLQSHQKIHSCNICGKSFIHLKSLIEHTAGHTGQKQYTCNICNKAFHLKSMMVSHQKVHDENKPYKCDFCEKSFSYKGHLKIHSRLHTGERPYQCNVCSRTLTTRRSLSTHMLIHSGEKPHGCEVCGKRFKRLHGLRSHENIHKVRDKPYLCEVCCKAFHSAFQLKAHLKTHSAQQERTHVCSECGKGFTAKMNLMVHMKSHSEERPFICSECGKSFKLKSHLNAHLKLHTGLQPFVCCICGKTCGRQEHLVVHMRTHNGEKPYQCTLCDKAFTQSHCLKTHMKSHQGDKTPAVDGSYSQKPFL